MRIGQRSLADRAAQKTREAVKLTRTGRDRPRVAAGPATYPDTAGSAWNTADIDGQAPPSAYARATSSKIAHSRS